MTDAKNRVTTYTYDSRCRQLTTTTPDNKTVAKSYDGLGLVIGVNYNGDVNIAPSVSGPNAVNTPVTFQVRWGNSAYGVPANSSIQITVAASLVRQLRIATTQPTSYR